MGQQDVYNFLKTNKGKWYSSREIATKLKISIGSATNSLKKLRKTKEIKFKHTKNKNHYIYSY